MVVKPAPPTRIVNHGGPFLLRPQWHEELGVVKTGRVGAVVGPADLGDDRFHFGKRAHDRTGDLAFARRIVERGIQGEGSANPQVAFLQFRHEFAAQPRQSVKNRAADEKREQAQGETSMVEKEPELLQIGPFQPAHHAVVLPRLQVFEEQHARTGESSQRQQQGAAECEGVGVGHRAEQLAFGTGHREQRHEGADDDRRGEEQGLLHFQAGEENALLQRQFGMFAGTELAVDVLDHDDGRVDDDAEVDRPDRQQVGGFAARVQHGEREQKCQRNVDGHDDGAADVAEEHQQDHGHEHHAHDQVFLDGVRRDVDQFGAVVIRFDLHARQQPARIGLVEFLDLLFDGGQGGKSVLAFAHEDDALDLVVLVAGQQFAVNVDNAIDGRCLGMVGHAQSGTAKAGLIADDDPFHPYRLTMTASRPPTTRSPTNIGELLIDVTTTSRISAMRLLSSSRKILTAALAMPALFLAQFGRLRLVLPFRFG